MSGKNSALQRLFTEVWVGNNGKSVFDRIYIFSPSVGSSFEDGIDETWTPAKRLVETQLIDRSNPMHSREQYFSTSWTRKLWNASRTSSTCSSE